MCTASREHAFPGPSPGRLLESKSRSSHRFLLPSDLSPVQAEPRPCAALLLQEGLAFRVGRAASGGSIDQSKRPGCIAGGDHGPAWEAGGWQGGSAAAASGSSQVTPVKPGSYRPPDWGALSPHLPSSSSRSPAGARCPAPASPDRLRTACSPWPWGFTARVRGSRSPEALPAPSV